MTDTKDKLVALARAIEVLRRADMKQAPVVHVFGDGSAGIHDSKDRLWLVEDGTLTDGEWTACRFGDRVATHRRFVPGGTLKQVLRGASESGEPPAAAADADANAKKPRETRTIALDTPSSHRTKSVSQLERQLGLAARK